MAFLIRSTWKTQLFMNYYICTITRSSKSTGLICVTSRAARCAFLVLLALMRTSSSSPNFTRYARRISVVIASGTENLCEEEYSAYPITTRYVSINHPHQSPINVHFFERYVFEGGRYCLLHNIPIARAHPTLSGLSMKFGRAVSPIQGHLTRCVNS